MADLTEFLLARIAEDEVDAETAEGRRWSRDGTWHLEGVEHDVVVSADLRRNEIAFTGPDEVAHVARHDPARVLAECEAKRRIVGLALDATSDRFTEGYAAAINSVLHELALPYADHPDYRDEWKP